MSLSTIAELSPPCQEYLHNTILQNNRSLALDQDTNLITLAQRANLDEVDIILMLLQGNFLDDAERCAGQPITHCPLADCATQGITLLERIAGILDAARHRERYDIDNWVVASIDEGRSPPVINSRPFTNHHRFIRVGQTVRSMVARGLTYEWLDEAQSRGWLKLSAPQNGRVPRHLMGTG